MGEAKIRVPVWARDPKPVREQRKQLSRTDIVDAAVLLADRSGIDAVSIRKLAGELGTRPMSLYRHIDCRDELLELMYDAVIPRYDRVDHSGSWRADFGVLARKMRAISLAHPWSARMMSDSQPSLGPNALSGFEWTFTAVSELGLSINEMYHVVSTFVGVVNSALQSEIAVIEEQHRTIEEWEKVMAPYLEKIVSGGKYPLCAQFFTNEQRSSPQEDFEAKIAIVLDGLEKYIREHANDQQGAARG